MYYSIGERGLVTCVRDHGPDELAGRVRRTRDGRLLFTRSPAGSSRRTICATSPRRWSTARSTKRKPPRPRAADG